MFKMTPTPHISSPHLVTLFGDVDTVTYDQMPSDLFPGMSSDGTDLTIPIASMSAYGLTDALSQPSTGDARMLAYCLAARIEDWYTSLATAARPEALVADPAKSIPKVSGDFVGKEKTVHKFTFYRERPEGPISAEPT